jgi:hypothetical protein
MLVTVCAALAVTGAALSGCTASDGRPATHGRPADVGKLRDLTYAEQVTVERGEDLLVKRCMKKRGFPYWIGPIASVADRQGQGYVLTDVAWAKEYGYGGQLRERAERERLADRNIAYARALPKRDLLRYSSALDGTLSGGVVKVRLPTGGTVWTARGGCRAQAMSDLYGDFPTWFRVKKTAQNLTALYAPDILADARFKRALTAWAACMSKAGHPYADPQQLRRKLPGLTKGAGPKAAHDIEVGLAVAEATCANSTPLAGTARTVERELRREKLRPYRDDIATFQRMNLTALVRARALDDAG